MERWYAGFRTRKSPYELTESLGRLVRQHKLGDLITRACYERRTGGEYYYFVGIISEEKGNIPEEVPFVLRQLALYDQGIYVYYDEIQHMASKEIESFNFRQIRMAQPRKYIQSDPFDFTASAEEGLRTTDETSPAFNQLLICLSAYGRGTWQQFRTICAEIGIDSTGEYSRRISRRLRSLGHIELSKDGQNWYAAPSCLVQVDDGYHQYHAFLAGQRSHRLLEELQRESARTSVTAQPYGNAPEEYLVSFPDETSAQSFADTYSRQHHPIRLVGYAGLKIANHLPSLDEWEVSLSEPSIVEGHYSFEQWVGGGSFKSIPLPKETGMYRLKHDSKGFEHPQMTLYYNADTKTWRRAEWYGIRFLTLRRTGISCDVHYDHARRELAIHRDQRWPDLYERSLVLASGQLPSYRNSHAIYTNISAEQAHILADKLGANLIEHGGI